MISFPAVEIVLLTIFVNVMFNSWLIRYYRRESRYYFEKLKDLPNALREEMMYELEIRYKAAINGLIGKTIVASVVSTSIYLVGVWYVLNRYNLI